MVASVRRCGRTTFRCCLQIWNAVAGNNPFLSKQQFYTAMRLVSAAQVTDMDH